MFEQQFAVINQVHNEESLVLITDSLTTEKNVRSAAKKERQKENVGNNFSAG